MKGTITHLGKQFAVTMQTPAAKAETLKQDLALIFAAHTLPAAEAKVLFDQQLLKEQEATLKAVARARKQLHLDD